MEEINHFLRLTAKFLYIITTAVFKTLPTFSNSKILKRCKLSILLKLFSKNRAVLVKSQIVQIMFPKIGTFWEVLDKAL